MSLHAWREPSAEGVGFEPTDPAKGQRFSRLDSKTIINQRYRCDVRLKRSDCFVGSILHKGHYSNCHVRLNSSFNIGFPYTITRAYNDTPIYCVKEYAYWHYTSKISSPLFLY